ncbi:MAG: pyridoxal phosphate-dependent aminotransferase [Candidatus Competibacteraceae bacterium]|nr:pyridoxal phosphate-dependent aminotransferase [Candidatus Competibacteraceae bacterium]
MSTQLSARVQLIKPSPTLAVTAKANALKAAGHNVVGLGAGEPDFDTPDFIKEAAIQSLHDGFTKYTPVGGTPGLKKAIIAKFERDNGLQYAPDQILVSCGAKHSIYNVMQALLNKDDEVIIPAPYWVSYPDMALLAEAKPVIVTAGVEQRFKITPEQLAAAITPRSRLFIINSPSNPTGIAYTRAELAALGEVLLKHPQIMIVTDDIYESILWTDEPFSNIVMACPDLYDRTFVINGVSKAYAMTGWRIGYCGGPKDLIKAMDNIQSQSTSNPTSIAQVAAQAALDGDQSCITTMLKAFKERHAYVYETLQTLDGVEVLPADGTFYSFPNFSRFMATKFKNDIEMAEYFLTEAGVAMVPGSAFGADGCMRISFATSMKNLEEGLQRIAKALG